MSTLFFIAFFALAVAGRWLMRRAAGLGVPEPAPGEGAKAKRRVPPSGRTPRRPLILSLAANGALTNGRPLCPQRQPINRTRS